MLSAEHADRAVRAYWRQSNGWIEPDTVSWRYDEQRTALVLPLAGKGKLDWKRFDVPEITAEQAKEVNRSLPTFNNNVSRAYQIASNDKASTHELRPSPPFVGYTDWTSSDAPCGLPAK